ncbi:MAG TPA: hypothetical protein VNH53_02480 [Sphingomicrobium sp.]|nr:hypothetical protein [Sphingomicrobium sp.]
MKTIPVVAAVGALLLAACETIPVGPVGDATTEVYRSHGGQVAAPARIAVAPVDLARSGDPVLSAYVGAVAAELSRQGFTPVGDIGMAELLASVDVRTGSAGELAMTGPAPLRAQTTLVAPAPATALIVQISRRHDGVGLWQGRAISQMQPRAGDLAALSMPLARALFADFPGESGRTIRSR